MDTIDPNLITINRDERQRRQLTGIDELADSIAAHGMLNPIIVDEDLTLIAGERRLTAALQIGMAEVPVRYFSSLSQKQRHLIELEENVKRVDLDWKDHVKAVRDYYTLRSDEPNWTQDMAAAELAMSPSTLSRMLVVADNFSNPLVASADKFSVAYNVASRAIERQSTAARGDVAAFVDELFSPPTTEKASAPVPAPKRVKGQILAADFTSWLKTYSGPKFNFIHCDFPYGKSVGDKIGQSAAKITGTYSDTQEVYFGLLEALAAAMPHVADSAHIIFWFSMDYYPHTLLRLRSMGWTVDPFPLIWHKSDNAGMLPDPNRGPRRTYETAFFGRRGDRKIVKAVANSFSGPTTRELHTSEKPRPMLNHFFRMVVDESTTMLDPTCGSGNAVRVSTELGAAFSLGLELNPEFAENAKANLAKAGDFIAP